MYIPDNYFWAFGIAFKGMGAMLILTFALSCRWLIHHTMPEGRLKTFILKHRGGKHRDAFMR